MTQQEDYFPRGGVKRKATEADKKIPKTENLFNVNADKKKSAAAKKARKIRKEADSEAAGFNTNLRLNSVDTLSYKKIQEGMLLLGCIRKIKSVSLEVELPGRTQGLVLIKNISQPYSKELFETLEDSKDDLMNLNRIFTPGQFLPTKVLSVEQEDKGTKVCLSTDPMDVNSALRHTHIKTGMLVWGAISEKHDHGYVVDLGVTNCRALLSYDNIDEDKKYEIGQTFYSVIVKCENTKHAATVTLSATEDVIGENIEGSELSLDHIIPGMQVNFTISTIVKHGLEGTFLNNFTGYINDLYLNYPLESLKNYHEEQVLKARVLYVQPSTKFSYLTLRNLDVVEKPKLKVGAKLNCQVREKINSGVVVKINVTDMGFVTYKRIIKGLNTSEGDFQQIISNKYAIGTQHHCVIIDYNHLERLYICTFETNVLKEGFLTRDDLVLGQEINGVISDIRRQGLVIKMGNLEGFVNNLHLSSAIYSEKIKGKFKVGQKVKARVWYVDDVSDNIQLTMKPELLKDGRVLDENNKNKECLGVVAKPTKAGVLVVFFGNKRGWLPNAQIPQLSGNDASNIFYEGQVIQCYILNKTDDRITLTLKPGVKTELTTVQLGDIIESARVTGVTPLGLDLFWEKKGVTLFLPVEHLMSNLGNSVLDTYKEGDTVENLVCISAEKKAIVSLKETPYYRVLTVDHLKENTILRCYYNRHIDGGIIIFTPLKNYKTIFVHNSRVGTELDIKFNPYQVLYFNPCFIERSKKKTRIIGSIMLRDVFKYNSSSTYDYLEEHLKGMDSARKRLQHAGEAIGDLEIGQLVNCVVNKVDKKRGCSVFIKPNQCNGIVELIHMTDELKPKDHCKALVIGINYEHKFALLTLKKNLIEKVESRGEFPQDCKKAFTKLLTVNNKFALGLHVTGHPIYLPVQLNPNDYNPLTKYYTSLSNSRIRAIECRVSCGRILGFEKGMHKLLTRLYNGMETMASLKRERKRKHSSVITEIKEEVESPPQSDDDVADSDGEEDACEVVENTDAVIHELVDENKVEESDEENDAGFTLPGMDSFFDANKSTEAEADKASSDEDETEDEPAKKKKRLSNAERALVAKEEERRLQKIENELAESSTLPQSAEQFDRVLLGNPDDSEMWLRYIAFHTQSTELEKARAVVKRALEKISYTATQERLNVWLAYLNLENMYGTKATFDKVFEEACRCNDTLTIYLESIQMLSEMQKFNEMDEKIKKARSKFKEELRMWLEIAKVYYKCKRFVDARKLKDVAITTISNKKTHIDLLVQFAILEFTEGEAAHGEALFETIIQTDPKRVDVWCTYIDQLIKENKIEIARSVLNRAVGQKLVYKKMRTLFKKYITFEKEHGDEETLEHATKLLKEYTKE